MNKVILLGRLTKDPETRYTQTTNTQVTSFSLAVPRRFKQEGQPKVDFINIVAWSKTAEFVSQYFKKGQQVAAVGRIQTRDYDDTEGKKHYVTEVIAEEVYFADSKKEGQVDASNLGNSTPVTNNDFEIKEEKEKISTKTKFYVEAIQIENKEITALSIKNNKNKRVFIYMKKEGK